MARSCARAARARADFFRANRSDAFCSLLATIIIPLEIGSIMTLFSKCEQLHERLQRVRLRLERIQQREAQRLDAGVRDL